MSIDDLSPWTHAHRFETGGETGAERRTNAVVALTLVMMAAEILVGTLTNSMALLADGFHMSTHAAALSIAAFAYRHARRHAEDPRYTFGTGKVGALAAFTSAIILGMVVVAMLYESGRRLLSEQEIGFDEALWVAGIGLVVNAVSALILGHDDHDHNLRAAYVHVLADAFTSILAVLALLAGKFLALWWLDPLMGVVGAVVIGLWSWNLARGSGNVLLDRSEDGALAAQLRLAVEADADNRVTDLHLWQIGPGHWAAIVGVVTAHPQPPQHYRSLLAAVRHLSHVTIEVHRR